MRNPRSVPKLMFPSRGSVSTLAAFAPLGPGAEPVPHHHRSYAAIRLPMPLRHASGLPSVVPYQSRKRWFCAPRLSVVTPRRRSACRRRRVGVGHRFSVARILRLDGQGSPRLPGRLLRPCHSRPPRRSPFGSPLAPPGMLLSWLLSP